MALTSFPAGVLVLRGHFCSFSRLSRPRPLTGGIAVVCTPVGGSASSGHLRAFTHLSVGQGPGRPSPWASRTPTPQWSSLLKEPDPWAGAEKMSAASYYLVSSWQCGFC